MMSGAEGFAEGGTRTPTVLLPPAPQAGASANSATSAWVSNRNDSSTAERIGAMQNPQYISRKPDGTSNAERPDQHPEARGRGSPHSGFVFNSASCFLDERLD